MKILFLSILLILTGISSYCTCTIKCKAQYKYRVLHKSAPPSITTKMLGTIPIFAGSNDYYEEKITEVYQMELIFCSGYEYNEYQSKKIYNDNSIIAIVKWSNGGFSEILISNWTTEMKYIDEKEVIYDSNGNRLYKITGVDNEERIWFLYL